MEGAPADTKSDNVLPAAPLLSRTQLLVGVVSPKISEPIPRGESKWTVLSPARLSVLKSAMASVPLAITLPVQFKALDHKPPLVRLVHVPLAGWANCGTASTATNARLSCTTDGFMGTPSLDRGLPCPVPPTLLQARRANRSSRRADWVRRHLE